MGRVGEESGCVGDLCELTKSFSEGIGVQDVTGDVDQPEAVIERLCDAINLLEGICSEAQCRKDPFLLLVELADLEIIANPMVILSVAEDAPNNIISQALGYGPVLYLIVAKPAAKSVAARAEPERALLIGEDGADVGKVQTVGSVERLPAIAVPTCDPVAGLREDAAIPIFSKGEDARTGKGGDVARGNVPGDEGSASGNENADVSGISYP